MNRARHVSRLQPQEWNAFILKTVEIKYLNLAYLTYYNCGEKYIRH